MKHAFSNLFQRYGYQLAIATAFAIPLRLSWTYIFLIPLLLFWILEVRSGVFGRFRTVPTPLWAPFALWLLLCVAAAPFGIDPLNSIRQVISPLFLLMIVPAVSSLAKEHGQVKILWAIIAGQTLAAIHSVIETRLPPTFQSLFNGKVTESGQLAVTIILTLGLIVHHFISRPGTKQPCSTRCRLALICSILLMLCAALVNLKRGPWIAILISSTLFWSFYSRRLALLAVSIGIALIFALEPVRNRFADSYEHFAIAGGRNSMWGIGADLAGKYPLGIGFHNAKFMQKLDPALPPEHKHFHNNFINIAVETGWLGLGLIVWWLMGILRLCFSSNNSSEMRPMLVACGCAIISWQLAGLVEYNFGDSEIFILIMLVVAILADSLDRSGYHVVQQRCAQSESCT